MRVAVAQFDPTLGDPASNLRRITDRIAAAAESGAHLLVLPECAVSGYVYESLDEAWAVAETVPGPSSDAIVAAARKHRLYVVCGMLERDGERLFNSALLCGPQGLITVYHKSHILCLGVDRFTTPGDRPLAVHDLPIGRIGILICYDLRFPESARVLALEGAQIVCLPTNWPVASSIQADVFTRARAAENRVFVLAADRVGREREGTFLGRSQIVAPSGDVLAEASPTDEEMLVCDVDPHEADRKNVVFRAGEHEMDCFADRRPDLYRVVAEERLGIV